MYIKLLSCISLALNLKNQEKSFTIMHFLLKLRQNIKLVFDKLHVVPQAFPCLEDLRADGTRDPRGGQVVGLHVGLDVVLVPRGLAAETADPAEDRVLVHTLRDLVIQH